MAATLAILVALVASTSALSLNQNSRSPSKAVFEWAVQSSLDPRFFNTERSFLFVDRQSQRLNWQVDAIRDISGVKVSLQVFSQNQKGHWKEIENHKNIRLNTASTPQIVTDYATIIGMQDSTPAVIRSRNSQAAPSNAAAQSAEASSGLSSEGSAAQSAERSFSRSARPSIAKAAQSSAYSGLISLENFSPSKSQISPDISAGRQLMQMSFTDNKNRIILSTSFMVLFRI